MQWWPAAARRRAPRRHPARRLAGFEPLEDRMLLAAVSAPLAVPQLASRPGAPATLFLDFDGNTERQWGSHTNVVTPPYDSDGVPAVFSSAEAAAIREIWARVAEDYAPFNLNVTTLPPPRIADRLAARVAIGGSYADWYGSPAGGVSYVGGFAGGASNVAFVFSTTLASGNVRYVAEAASHEAGHLFGLEHQATWQNGKLTSEYSAGTTDWAPIMGLSYYAGRTTWTNGPTSGGPTAYEDELGIIASSSNGFGYVPDDFPGTLAAAAPLARSGPNLSAAGTIGKNDDRDVFSFTTSGGQLNFTLATAPFGSNLTGVMELQNAQGRTLAAATTSGAAAANLAATVGAGSYFLAVRSSGGYGNLGRYTVRGSAAAATSAPAGPAPSPDQPEGEPPPEPVTTSLAIADDGTASFAGAGAWRKVTGAGFGSDTQWAAAGSSASAAWTFTGLTPGQYRIAATWSGSKLNAVDAPFSIAAGSRVLGTVKVNQQRATSTFTADGAAWQNLGTFTVTGNSLTVRLNSAASGRVVADAIRLERVYAVRGGSTPSHAVLVRMVDGANFTAPEVFSGGAFDVPPAGDRKLAVVHEPGQRRQPIASGRDAEPKSAIRLMTHPEETREISAAVDAVLSDEQLLAGWFRQGN